MKLMNRGVLKERERAERGRGRRGRRGRREEEREENLVMVYPNWRGMRYATISWPVSVEVVGSSG